MEKKGVVSLWLGNVETNEFLKNYVDMRYTDDDNWEASQFLNDFNIDMDAIEEDFIEKVTYPEISNNLEKLLLRCSYEDNWRLLFANWNCLWKLNFQRSYFHLTKLFIIWHQL